MIFARGSGEGLAGDNYKSLKASLTESLSKLGVSFSFYELGRAAQGGYQYPAVSAANLSTMLGAKVSAGGAFSYGRSVRQGIGELEAYFKARAAECEDTRFILAGYSQGAQVMSSSLMRIDSTRVLYVATFGDPKLYFPEGKATGSDILPAACMGKRKSSYRIKVPDCTVYQGVLGGFMPYMRYGYSWKLGAWCNMNDFMCGSKVKFSSLLSGHLAYKTDGSYAMLAEQIERKLAGEIAGILGVEGFDDLATLNSVDVGPKVEIVAYRKEGEALRVKLEKAEGTKLLISVNDGILGFFEGDEILITDLSEDATVRFLPVSAEGDFGEAEEIEYRLAGMEGYGEMGGADSVDNSGVEDGSDTSFSGETGGVSMSSASPAHITPKAPNTGRK